MDHAKGSRPLSTKVSDEATCVATTAASKLPASLIEGRRGYLSQQLMTNVKLVSLGEGITSKKWFLILNLVRSNPHPQMMGKHSGTQVATSSPLNSACQGP